MQHTRTSVTSERLHHCGKDPTTVDGRCSILNSGQRDLGRSRFCLISADSVFCDSLALAWRASAEMMFPKPRGIISRDRSILWLLWPVDRFQPK